MPEHFYAVVSDIHGNYPAVAAVEEDAKQFARDQGLPQPEFICLGDTVDYGPRPNECMTWLARVKPIIMVQGNHDTEACRPPRSRFRRVNHEFWATALWTRYNLEPEHRTALKRLEVVAQGQNGLGKFKFFHSDPKGDETITYDTADQAKGYFDSAPPTEFPAKLCFAAFGHSHFQMLWVHDGALRPVYAVPEERTECDMHKRVNCWHETQDDCRYLINPGSVGQPRFRSDQPSRRRLDDGPSDLRAAYMVFYRDQDGVVHFQWRRVDYGRAETLKQMEQMTVLAWPKDILKADPAPLLPVGHEDYEPDQFSDDELARIMAELPTAVEKLKKFIQ